jgi:L-asparaginase II
MDPSRAAACKRITNAMMSHPNMVAGPRKFDTVIMEQTNRKVISKAGAEGYHVLGVMPDAIQAGSPGLGIALKIADGDAEERVRPLVIIEILRQLGVLNSEELKILEKFSARRIFNTARLDIGEYRPTFDIK